MGSTESKQEEHKQIDATGNVNNNVIIGGEVDVFSVEIVVLLGIICIIKMIEIVYFLYTRCYHRMKRQATGRLALTA